MFRLQEISTSEWLKAMQKDCIECFQSYSESTNNENIVRPEHLHRKQ